MNRLTVVVVLLAMLMAGACSAAPVLKDQWLGGISSEAALWPTTQTRAGTAWATGWSSVEWRVSYFEPFPSIHDDAAEWGPYRYEYWVTTPAGSGMILPDYWLLEVTKDGEWGPVYGYDGWTNPADHPNMYNISDQVVPGSPLYNFGGSGGTVGVGGYVPYYVGDGSDQLDPDYGPEYDGLSSIWAVKVEPIDNMVIHDGATKCTMYIAFDSWRAPVWADFYLRGDNNATAMWNPGYGGPGRFDPIADYSGAWDEDGVQISAGTYAGKILAPDGIVPEPATVALIALGLGAVAGTRRRKRKED